MDQDTTRLYAESVKAIARQVDDAASLMAASALAKAMMEMSDAVLRRLDGDAAAAIPHIRAAE